MVFRKDSGTEATYKNFVATSSYPSCVVVITVVGGLWGNGVLLFSPEALFSAISFRGSHRSCVFFIIYM